jgi:glycine oxidase
MGELTARALVRRGCAVTLFDRHDRRRERQRPAGERASAVAAGLLSSFSGRELPEPAVRAWAEEAMPRWRAIAEEGGVPFGDQGSLVVASLGQEALLDELHRGLRRRELDVTALDGPALRTLEPELSAHRALHLPGEGWIDAQAALAWLSSVRGVARVYADAAPTPHAVSTASGVHRFDRVLDCRGFGARGDWPALRGVRGELVFVEAPEVSITRPVRVLGARAPIYVVPRGGRRYVVGATLVESEDRGPVSVRAVLELLGAAASFHPGFTDAKILRTAVGVRPTLPDNLPAMEVEPGLVRVNGLYRHGFVVGPALAERAADALLDEEARTCASS